MGTEALNSIALGMALLCLPGRRDRVKTDMRCDSTGYSLKVTVPWRTAKYGDGSQKDYCQLHAIPAVGGSSWPLRLPQGTRTTRRGSAPCWSGYRTGRGSVVLDAGYDANLNYEAIVGSGREPYINMRRGSEPRGFGERAKAMRRYRDDPEDFAEQYGKRNN